MSRPISEIEVGEECEALLGEQWCSGIAEVVRSDGIGFNSTGNRFYRIYRPFDLVRWPQPKATPKRGQIWQSDIDQKEWLIDSSDIDGIMAAPSKAGRGFTEICYFTMTEVRNWKLIKDSSAPTPAPDAAGLFHDRIHKDLPGVRVPNKETQKVPQPKAAPSRPWRECIPLDRSEQAIALRGFRLRENLSIADVAEIVDLSEETLADMEAGLIEIDAKEAIHLGRALNCSPELLTIEKVPNKETSSIRAQILKAMAAKDFAINSAIYNDGKPKKAVPTTYRVGGGQATKDAEEVLQRLATKYKLSEIKEPLVCVRYATRKIAATGQHITVCVVNGEHVGIAVQCMACEPCFTVLEGERFDSYRPKTWDKHNPTIGRSVALHRALMSMLGLSKDSP